MVLNQSPSSDSLSLSRSESRKRTADKKAAMKPYSAKILKVPSKEKVLMKETRQGKISRRSQFSHVVPKKKESALKGSWILWVRAGKSDSHFAGIPSLHFKHACI